MKPFGAAYVHMSGEFNGTYMHFLINPRDACGNYGFDCPVEEYESNKLMLTVPLLSIYPTDPITVKLHMTDEQKRSIVCVKFPGKVVG